MKDNPMDQSDKIRALSQLLKRKEKQWLESQEKLAASVHQLASAAQGQDHSLDQVLVELRKSMQGGEPNPALINKLGTAAKAMVAIRRSRAQKQLQGFSACIAQLLLLEPPEEMRKQLADFVVQARRVIADPSQQELLPIKFSRLQGKLLEPHYADGGKKEIIGEGDSIVDVEEAFKDDALEGLPPFASVADHIEGVLLDLVVQIRPAESAGDALEAVRQILSGGLNWYELAALLEQLSVVVLASLETDQQEFELFLQLLNEQLSGVNDGFTGLGSSVDEFFTSGDEFDERLREGMQGFAGELASADSLLTLKSSVQTHLDTVVHQLDDFKQARQRQQSDYEEEIISLQQRVAELEAAGEEAQQELNARQKRSERDSLTGMPNREAYDRRLQLELERFTRYDRPFCLVVADVDPFKAVNDNYGHLAGDKVLKVIAKLIRQRLRRPDFIARYGGEEFAIILPETNASDALAVIDQVRAQIADCPFHFKNEPINITVSFGLTQCAEGDDHETVFVRADEALYAAKADGRNCCKAQPAVFDKSA